MAKSTVRQELGTAVAKCILISINGESYFGEIKTVEGVTKVSNAVESADNISDTVSNWIKTKNLNNLLTLEVSGDALFVKRELTNDESDSVELVVIKAARAINNALSELVNSKF